MTMNHGGYSNLSREKAREQIKYVKEQNKQEVFVRKQKIKQLSNQTNHLRRKIEEKKQNNDSEDEKRRHRILKMRKLKQDTATEKFQRTPDKKSRAEQHYKKDNNQKTSQVSNDILKDGTYCVSGHIIEIRNGMRVQTSNKNMTAQQHLESSVVENNNNNNTYISHVNQVSTFQKRLYEPNSYLDTHLSNLLQHDAPSNNTPSNNTFVGHTERAKAQFDNISNNINEFDVNFAEQERYFAEPEELDMRLMVLSSSSDSVCSNDSLDIDPFDQNTQSGQQKALRSSLKGSAFKLTESARKVRFSDSIEFNDGDTRLLFTPPAAKIPLYKRMGHSIKQDVHKDVSINETKETITTEQLLDQIRQEALLPKYPHNGDFSYPDSVVINPPSMSKVAVVSPLAPENVSNVHSTEDAVREENIMSENQKLVVNTEVAQHDNQQISVDSLNSIGANDSLEVADQQHIKTKIQSNDEELYSPSSNVNILKLADAIPIETSVVLHTNMDANSNDTMTCPVGNVQPEEYVVGSHENPSNVNNFTPQNCYQTLQQHQTHISGPYGNAFIQQSSKVESGVHKEKSSNNDQVISADSSYTIASNTLQNSRKFGTPISSITRVSCPKTTHKKTSAKNGLSKHCTSKRGKSSSLQDIGSVTENSVVANSNHSTSHTRELSFTKPRSNVNTYNCNEVKDVASLQQQQITHVNFLDNDSDQCGSKPCVLMVGGADDDIYKSVEQSLAGITFENKPGDVLLADRINTDVNMEILNKSSNNATSNLMFIDNNSKDDEHLIEKRESEKIHSAVKDGTAIPVRVHSASTVRRGRIIVSANAKKRKQQNVGHFTPHPPPKVKGVNAQQKRQRSDEHVDQNSATRNPNPLKTTNSTPRKRGSTADKINTKALQPRMKSATVRVTSTPSSPKIRSQSARSDNRREMSSHSLYVPFTQTQSISNQLHQNYSNNTPKTNHQNTDEFRAPNYRIPLDKTPTDDEINMLWANVRGCLSTDMPEHDHSDSVYAIDSNKYHHNSSFHRRSSSGNVHMSKTHPNSGQVNKNNGNTIHRRFGSQEILYRRENSYDSIHSTSSFPRRQALLPQRVTRVLSPNIYGNFSENSINKKPTRYKESPRLNVRKEEKSEVTASMATFLALEDLCIQQSLTPRQTEAVFKASKSLLRKQNFDTASEQGMSAISIEEQKVIKSLDRINKKLKEQEEVQRKLTPRKDQP